MTSVPSIFLEQRAFRRTPLPPLRLLFLAAFMRRQTIAPDCKMRWQTPAIEHQADKWKQVFIDALGAFPLFLQSRKRSDLLFLRSSERRTASHFGWNCSDSRNKRKGRLEGGLSNTGSRSDQRE